MKIKPIFSWSYVNMMTGSRVIAGSFRDNISRLGILNNNWNLAYADSLILRIEEGFEKYLGMDAQREQVQATTNLNNLKEEALRDLKMVRNLNFHRAIRDEDKESSPSDE